MPVIEEHIIKKLEKPFIDSTGKQIIVFNHRTKAYKDFKINIHNLPFKVTSIQVDNVEVNLDTFKNGETQAISIDKTFTELHLFGN